MMRTDLDHLPWRKRRELERVVEIIFEEFEEATRSGTVEHKRRARILKIVLYGSYARGDWVEDRVSGYRSDYDLLIVVNHDKLTEREADFWGRVDQRLIDEMLIHKRLQTPVNFIVHTMSDVNDQLRRGRYFFVDIVKDGIALYEAPGHPFAPPEPLSDEAAREEAQGYFDTWFESADRYFQNAKDDIARGWSKEAAFLLHQATERLYHCTLLVLTLYSPPSHRLNFLRPKAESLDARLIEAWPRDTKFSRRCFELLGRAYVHARYSKHYKISAEELDWIGQRVERLRDLVRTICEERLRPLPPPAQDPSASPADDATSEL